MRRDEKPTVPQQAPYVDPALSNNAAARKYAQGLAARKGGMPVAGGPTPPIPALESKSRDGMTMSQQAMAQRQPQGPGIFAPQAPMLAPDSILPTDLLPDVAQSDPAFREGQGAMYAVNQPMLAFKYGVMRNGRQLSPGELRGEKKQGILSKETVEGLKAVEAFNQTRMQAESLSHGAERAATEGTSGEVAKLADPSQDPSAKPVEKGEVERAVENMDDFDFDSFRDLIMKDILNNAEQKQIVEDRLVPLDLGDLIDNGTIKQRIPIVPGKYEVTLQSVTGEEELAMKRLIVAEKGKVEAPDRYLLDKFRLMMVALGLYAVNNRVLPDHHDVATGNFDEAAFWKKFNIVLKLPFHMLASIATHYYYFDIRVRSLFKAIKNG